MITVSDNASANDLTKLLGDGDEASGRSAVEAFARSIGCDSVQYNRLMLVENGTQNYVSAEDCATLLRMIYTGQCVSQDASKSMLDHLLAQQVNDRIPQGLSSDVKVAHKTGDLLGICCADVGIVFAPQGDYLLCIVCNNQSDQQSAIQTCVSITRAVDAYFSA